MTSPQIIRLLDCTGFLPILRILLNPKNESTGLFFGEIKDSVIYCKMFTLIRNLSRRPDRFDMDPWSIVVAHVSAEKYSLKLVATYHTHPMGDPVPSALDIKSMVYWRVPWIIASPHGVRAWILDKNGVPREISIRFNNV